MCVFPFVCVCVFAVVADRLIVNATATPRAPLVRPQTAYTVERIVDVEWRGGWWFSSVLFAKTPCATNASFVVDRKVLIYRVLCT